MGEPRDVLTLARSRPRARPGPGALRRDGARRTPRTCSGTWWNYQVRPPRRYQGIELFRRGQGGTPGGDRDRARRPAHRRPGGAGLRRDALLNAATALPAPDGLDDAEGSRLLHTYQGPVVGMQRRAGLAAGETLARARRAGGSAAARVQLARRPAPGIGVAGGGQQGRGGPRPRADAVVDRTTQDLSRCVKEGHRGTRRDVVYDPVAARRTPGPPSARVRGPPT